MNQNDKKIEELKIVIKNKLKNLGDKKIFKPITHCIYKDLFIEKNINTLNENQLKELYVYLYNKNLSNKVLKNIKEIEISKEVILYNEYSIENWIKDVQLKLEVLIYNKKINELNKLEKKLEELLSEDKKTENSLIEIEKLLN